MQCNTQLPKWNTNINLLRIPVLFLFIIKTDNINRLYFILDVITIEKTNEYFRLIYDVKGRFTVHRISAEEAKVCFLSKLFSRPFEARYSEISHCTGQYMADTKMHTTVIVLSIFHERLITIVMQTICIDHCLFEVLEQSSELYLNVNEILLIYFTVQAVQS